MKIKLKLGVIFAVFLLASTHLFAQARLTIENNSQRSMTVKVMNGNENYNTLYETVIISSNNSETIYFSESGQYFTKTKAVLYGKKPVYQKGKPFYVTNDERGYSIMTLTFSIKESSVPQVTGGKQISKSEFDKN